MAKQQRYQVRVAQGDSLYDQVVTCEPVPQITSHNTLHMFLNWLDDVYPGDRFCGWSIVRLSDVGFAGDSRVAQLVFGSLIERDMVGWAWSHRAIINDYLRTHVKVL